jgi:hypothetical protein
MGQMSKLNLNVTESGISIELSFPSRCQVFDYCKHVSAKREKFLPIGKVNNFPSAALTTHNRRVSIIILADN